MFSNILGMIRKRRRVDGESELTNTPPPPPHRSSSMLTDDDHSCPLPMQINDSDSDLLVLSRRQLATIDSKKKTKNKTKNQKLESQDIRRSRNARSGFVNVNASDSVYDNNDNDNTISRVERVRPNTTSNNSAKLQRFPDLSEAMEIDSAPVPPPQEYSDSPSFQQQHSESSMNFDYLSGLTSSGMDASSSPGTGASSSFRRGTDSSGTSYGYVDDRAVDRPFNLNERFVGVLDQLDARVERFRKDALGLQEKRDFLLMSIDLIKTNDLLQGMSESEREEISCYIQRVNSRLSTVELNVRTVRDTSQEDSLSQINMLIDMMITLGDPVLSRQRCQQYLNACGSSSEVSGLGTFAEHGHGHEIIVDKKFESALLGCTLDDQKNIKKRLQALIGYLNKQTIHD